MKHTQILKGALDVAILAAVRRRETYGYDVLRLLEAAGLGAVGEASVYGALRRLEREGLLESRLAPSTEGPARRYYRPTDQGNAALLEWAAAWRQVAGALERLLVGPDHGGAA